MLLHCAEVQWGAITGPTPALITVTGGFRQPGWDTGVKPGENLLSFLPHPIAASHSFVGSNVTV